MPNGNSFKHNYVKWITKRTHLQISRTHVLPVVFKSIAVASKKSLTVASSGTILTMTPSAFPETQLSLNDAMPLVKDWLSTRLERVHRLTHANLKPGTLETPDVLRDGLEKKFTVWLEPTAASFALCYFPSKEEYGKQTNEAENDDQKCVFEPTAQTLHVSAEIEGILP